MALFSSLSPNVLYGLESHSGFATCSNLVSVFSVLTNKHQFSHFQKYNPDLSFSIKFPLQALQIKSHISDLYISNAILLLLCMFVVVCIGKFDCLK